MSSCAKIATKVIVSQESQKLHPEISNAIKRQNQTSAINYVSIQNSAMVGGNKNKKSDFGRLHSLTMEFPEVGFPLITHRLPRQNGQKVKKKVSLLGIDALSRSQSSINLTAPSLQDREKLNEETVAPNKASVTDLTCLQFADTLFSPSVGQNGMFGLSINKSKYMDYLEECITAKEKPLHKESESKERREKLSERISAYKSPRILKVTKPALPPTNPKIDKTASTVKKQSKGKSNDEQVQKDKLGSTAGKTPEKFQSPQDDLHLTVNRKSILKPGNSTDNEKDGNCVNTVRRIGDKIDSVQCEVRNRVIKNDLPEIVNKKDKTANESNVYVTVTPSTTRRNGYTTCSLNVNSNNGRSVRFNKSDEVFEYTPSEPIKIQ